MRLVYDKPSYYITGQLITIVILILLIFINITVPATAQPTEQDKEKDMKMIFEALDSYVQGWVSGDASLATQDYSYNIHWVDEFGKVIYTQKSLTEYMEKTFNKVENTNAPYPSMSHQITYLDPKIGVVHSMQIEKEVKKFHLRVLYKEGDSWKIINHHTSLVHPKEGE
ncbi:MAG: hypothetical protein AAF149_19305 [Bacteroidota bacterium]